MRKILFKTTTLFMALVLFQLQTMAGTPISLNSEDVAVVNFDESEIYNSFDQINDLVSYVSENGAVSYSDVASVNNVLVEKVDSTTTIAFHAQNVKEPPFISAFLWGCIMGWVGVVIVYVTTESNQAFTNEAWKGCALNAGCEVICTVISYVILFAASASYSYY